MTVTQQRFGRTGLSVPAVTLGCGWVGGLLIHGDQATRFAAMDQAMEAEVDWFDTAALYGKGASETNVGEWLAARGDKPRPRISTKFTVTDIQGHLGAQIRGSVAESFARLGVNRVEALLLHNEIVESGDGVTVDSILRPGGIADEMDALVADGLTSHIGFTGLGAPMALKTLAQSGRFDIAQVYYNMLNPTAGVAPAQGGTRPISQVCWPIAPHRIWG